MSILGDEKMTREELEGFIIDNYGVEPDYPWIKYPEYEVFRHQGNKKWFALIMAVPRNKLGLEGTEYLNYEATAPKYKKSRSK